MRMAADRQALTPFFLDSEDEIPTIAPVVLDDGDGTKPDPHAVEVCKFIDAINPGMRALVYEYGANIINAMWGEGYRDANALRPWMEVWRKRRQDALLSEDHGLNRKVWMNAIRNTGRRNKGRARPVPEAVADAVARSEARARG